MFRVHVVLCEFTVVLLFCCSLIFPADRPMSQCNIDALVALQRDLKLRVLMNTGLGDMLHKAAGGFMNAMEEQQVKEQHGNSNQMGKLIEILKGKRDRDFKTFLKMLRDANYKVWADELMDKAEKLRARESKMKCQFVL